MNKSVEIIEIKTLEDSAKEFVTKNGDIFHSLETANTADKANMLKDIVSNNIDSLRLAIQHYGKLVGTFDKEYESKKRIEFTLQDIPQSDGYSANKAMNNKLDYFLSSYQTLCTNQEFVKEIHSILSNDIKMSNKNNFIINIK